MPRFFTLATTWASVSSVLRTSSARSTRSSRFRRKLPLRNLSTRRRIGAKAPPANRLFCSYSRPSVMKCADSNCSAQSSSLVEEAPTKSEKDLSFQFESAHHITLGLLYEQNKRFAGGAFAPILKRVDKLLDGTLRKNLPVREERAEKVRATDEALAEAVAKLKKRGIKHPFVKNYVLARTTPLTRQRKTLPSFDQTFTKLRANIEAFDVNAVRYEDVQRSSLYSAPAASD